MGDVSVEEQPEDLCCKKSTKNDINNEIKDEESDTKPQKNSDSPKDKDICEIACKKDDESAEKIQLKSDVFYLEVVDDKKNPKEEVEENMPKPPPTPRRVNKLRDHTSNVFPAGCMGCREDPPSDHVTSPRRFLDPIEARDYVVGHIDITPRKRPSSAKPNTCPRNPLTGVGVNDDEVRKCYGRRRDGNPLLGEGYETKDLTPSSTRIPPGGYSQGLW